MYRDLPLQVPKDVLGETDDLGADALKLSVGAALGVKVDYYVLINLQGFTKLINALGGIRVNVNTYVPIGGDSDSGVAPDEQISPGANKKLKGREALWFARGRYGSDDYARMERQRCVVNAIIRQANPANVLTRYEDIAKAGKQIVKTDMPQEVLPLIVDLSLRVKDGNLRSIVFKNGVNGFSTVTPDWDQVRGRVKVAFGETKKHQVEHGHTQARRQRHRHQEADHPARGDRVRGRRRQLCLATRRGRQGQALPRSAYDRMTPRVGPAETGKGRSSPPSCTPAHAWRQPDARPPTSTPSSTS